MTAESMGALRMRNGSGPGTAGGFAIHCHGLVRLSCTGIDCTPVSKKGRALLAVLAAEQRPLGRTRIIDLLWSDRQEEQARASLRTLLADLKEQFGERFEELLSVGRESVALGASVRTDLVDASLARSAGELFEGLDHIDPELDDWLRVERSRREKQAETQPAVTGQASDVKDGQALKRWALAAVLLVTIAASALLYFRPWANPEQPVVAVLKFKDLTGRNALLADGIAEELRIHLAQHPTLNIIGRESSESMGMQHGNAVEAARQKLHATHVIEGTVLDRGGISAVSARLVSTRDNEVVWTDIVRPQGTSLRKSASQIAALIASNINESVGQGSGAAFEADAAAYSNLFKARQLNGKWEAQAAVQAKAILSPILERYPRFAPALALMAEATMRSSDHPSFAGPVPVAVARAQAVDFAGRAIKAAPEYGLAYSAMGIAHFGTGRDVEYQRRAVQLSPGSFEIHRRLARALESTGDLEGSLQHSRQAFALEPLNMRMAIAVERALAMTGRQNEIPPLIADFSRRSDNRADVLRLTQIASLDTGDLSGAYMAGLEASRLDPDDWIAANNCISVDVNLGRRKAALDLAERVKLPESGWLRLLIGRDIDAIERRMNEAGKEFWSLGSAREDASELLVANRRGAALVALYDRTRRETNGQEPNINLVPGALMTALQQSGRVRDADRILREAQVSWRELARDFSPGGRALYEAYLAAYAGNSARAIRQLEVAYAERWTNLMTITVPIEESTAFRPFRGQPRFEALLRGYYANIRRERSELEAELKRLDRNSGTS